MSGLKFVVTGTGRCGTVFMGKLLTSMGVPCGHESVFDYAAPQVVLDRYYGIGKCVLSGVSRKDEPKDRKNWVDISSIRADSSYMAVPYLSQIDSSIIHVVRHPLKVVSSFIHDLRYFNNGNSQYEKWIRFHVPEISNFKTPLTRACYYYVEWNSRIEKEGKSKGYLRHRIEDPNLDDIFNFLEVDPKLNVYGNKKSNTMRRKRHYGFDFTDLTGIHPYVKNRFFKMAEKYGYTTRFL